MWGWGGQGYWSFNPVVENAGPPEPPTGGSCRGVGGSTVTNWPRLPDDFTLAGTERSITPQTPEAPR